MKHTQLLIVFLLISLNLFSQTSGTVYYKYTIKKDLFSKEKIKKDDKNRNGSLSLINKSLRENADKIEFKLQFNKTESLYTFIENMDIDSNNMSYKIAKTLSGGNSVFYQNSKEKIQLTQKISYGKEFLILDSINSVKWSLINERKKIGNYICYKATTINVVKNSKGTFKTKIIAWYTPQLPFNFGPQGYAGLPGLILEFEEKNRILQAIKIKLNNKKTILIKRPKKGKFLHATEYKMMEEEIINNSKRKRK